MNNAFSRRDCTLFLCLKCVFVCVYWQGGSAKVSAGVKSLAFDSSGVLVWVGDEKVLLTIIMILMAFDISEIFSKSSPSVTPHSPSTNVLKEETTMVLGFSRQMFFPKSLRNPFHLRKKKL